MIHCLCNNINTATVDHAVECGAQTALDVQNFCGKQFNCGQCRESITQRLDLLKARPTPLLAAE